MLSLFCCNSDWTRSFDIGQWLTSMFKITLSGSGIWPGPSRNITREESARLVCVGRASTRPGQRKQCYVHRFLACIIHVWICMNWIVWNSRNTESWIVNEWCQGLGNHWSSALLPRHLQRCRRSRRRCSLSTALLSGCLAALHTLPEPLPSSCCWQLVIQVSIRWSITITITNFISILYITIQWNYNS